MKKRTNNRIYAAYGSNMNLVQMDLRCPGAEVIGMAELNGWKLAFCGAERGAHATILPEDGASTPVLVWAINGTHEASLDRYEGVAGGYYTKEYLPLTMGGEEYPDALVYVMRPMPYGLPTPGYLHGIVAGYRSQGIDIDPVTEALEVAVNHRGEPTAGMEAAV